ncbi:MAG: UbiA-like polyprenyltransferase [Sulfurovaceae bacterium]
MFRHSVFSLPFIFIAMFVAADGWFGWKLFFLGVLATVSARNFAMSTSILFFITVNALLFVGVSSFINALAFKLSIPILLVLGAYTLFKRFSSLAHLILGVSLGLAPIAGAIAVSEAIPLWSLYLAIGVMFWVAGFDLLYSLQDMEFDVAHKLHSIPSKFGSKNTLRIALIFHIFTIIFWTLFVIKASLGIWAYIAIVSSVIMLGYEHYLIRKDFTKIDRAFFTVNGYLGFIFLAFIIIETIFD